MASTPSSWIDHRDHAVVPWISLGATAKNNNFLVGASAASHDQTSSYPNYGSEHSRHHQQQRSRYTAAKQQQSSCKILSLLATRERIGIRSSAFSAAAGSVSVSRVGWLQEGRNVSTTSLAMSGAW